jgi:hypothetical protein
MSLKTISGLIICLSLGRRAIASERPESIVDQIVDNRQTRWAW